MPRRQFDKLFHFVIAQKSVRYHTSMTRGELASQRMLNFIEELL